MSELIHTDHGFIAADRIVRVTGGHNDTAVIEYVNADGHRATAIVPHSDAYELAERIGTVIPAQPRYFVVGVWFDDSDPVGSGIWKTAIIAWRITRLGVIPITPEGEKHEDAVLCPDGQVIEADVESWPTLEAFRETRVAEHRKAQAGTAVAA